MTLTHGDLFLVGSKVCDMISLLLQLLQMMMLAGKL